jgi:hypothetical protein
MGRRAGQSGASYIQVPRTWGCCAFRRNPRQSDSARTLSTTACAHRKSRGAGAGKPVLYQKRKRRGRDMCVIRRERQRQRQRERRRQRPVQPVKSNLVALDDRERDLATAPALSLLALRGQPRTAPSEESSRVESNPCRASLLASFPARAGREGGWMPSRTPPQEGTRLHPGSKAARSSPRRHPLSYSTLASGTTSCSLLAPPPSSSQYDRHWCQWNWQGGGSSLPRIDGTLRDITRWCGCALLRVAHRISPMGQCTSRVCTGH